jgi:chorismate mutase
VTPALSADRRVRALHAVAIVRKNTPEAIEASVHQLVEDLLNDPQVVVISAIFASSADLDAAFPATAARKRGVQGSVLGLKAAAAGRARRIEMLAHVAPSG